MTRVQFGEYCLRRLGFPVINIEIDPDQIEDRIDDALSKYREYHYDGRTLEYLSVEVDDALVAAGSLTLDDNVYSVNRILPVMSTSSGAGAGMFSVQYQFFLHEFYGTKGIVRGNISEISGLKQFIETLSRELIPLVSYNFNRKTSRVFFNESLSMIKNRAPYLIFEIERIVDPATYPKVWEDEWLRDYTTALLKKQWGQNVSKFGSFNLPGGMTINGEAIYSQAIEEITNLETRLMGDLQPPLGVYIG